MQPNNSVTTMNFRMDLTVSLIQEISEKTGTNEDEIWNQITDYVRLVQHIQQCIISSFRCKFPIEDGVKKIQMLNDNPKISAKMKYYVPTDGPWLCRIRTNQCHLFHSNDSISIGVVKEDLPDLKMKIGVRMKNNSAKTIKPCTTHEEKFRSKVKLVEITQTI